MMAEEALHITVDDQQHRHQQAHVDRHVDVQVPMHHDERVQLNAGRSLLNAGEDTLKASCEEGGIDDDQHDEADDRHTDERRTFQQSLNILY